MGEAQGADAGGHTFRVISEDGDLNVAACAACHEDDDALEDLVADRQAQIDALMAELGQLLLDRDLLRSNLEQNNTGIYEGHEAGVMFNYKYVLEDQSRGVHNFKYARALLENSIEAMK
jgi:formate-dependent nitrite reductase cytochrome c552 subunit